MARELIAHVPERITKAMVERLGQMFPKVTFEITPAQKPTFTTDMVYVVSDRYICLGDRDAVRKAAMEFAKEAGEMENSR